MDNLTHTLTGLMLSRAGLDRLTPRATPLLLLAVNAPDIDIVTLLRGQEFYFHHHRGITHALISIPFVALLPVLLVRYLGRAPLCWRGALIASLAGVLSHLALDCMNHYGVRLLLPWSSHWYDLGVTFVIDAFLYLLLFLGCAWPALSKLVSSEIGARHTHGRGLARFVLVAMVLYNSARILPWQRAVAVQEARLYEGRPPLRVTAIPHPVNPFRWAGLVETQTAYHLNDVNLLTGFDPTAGRVFPKTESSPEIDAARRTQPFQDLMQFTEFGLWRVTPAGEQTVAVRLFDLRFGAPPEPHFYATALVDGTGRVISSKFNH